MQYTDLWPLIQQDILAVLQADAFLANIPGVAIQPGSTGSVVAAAIDKALGVGSDGKVGTGYLVLPIEEGVDDNANLPQGPLRMPVIIDFVENVVLRDGPRGRGQWCAVRILAARAEKLLKLYWAPFLCKQLKPRNPVITLYRPTTGEDNFDQNIRVARVSFEAEEDDNAQLIKLPRPQITPNDGAGNGGAHPQTVTITCSGATAIYYTLDNSHPWSGNPAATLYSAPFTLSQAALVRARGFATGLQYLGSDTAAVSFT